MRTFHSRIASVLMFSLATAAAHASGVGAQDKRIGLKAGVTDAGVAAMNMELIGHMDKPAGFFNPQNLGDIFLANSDMAFRGNTLFLGNFTGFQIIDITNRAAPRLRTAVMCPGGQGDMSVYGNLLFMSVEMPNGRIDCGPGVMTGTPSPDRFLGVRIFDISDLDHPKQIAAVQTCRGSHTHTLVTDPKDKDNLYVYVSGTSGVRPASELAGCSGASPAQDPNTSLFRIEVIRVPLANPAAAAIVAGPRIFANAQTGAIAGLWTGGTHGQGTQSTARTDQCHDITAFPEIGLAAGACSGNGILLDISNPANPVRIAEVMDPNFAYWHSATFNNDGTKVIFTDEWGGGMSPYCRSTDNKLWGADAIYTLDNGKLTQAGFYKLPAAQTPSENCVAHNGSVIPVPGRDIMAQAWYQGGISVFDYTDPANVKEIAYFDRGPMTSSLALGGVWSAYWYNGSLFGSEIGRGLDVFRFTPSEWLTQNEIDAANLVQVDQWNPQHQQKAVWPTSYSVAMAYVDQLARSTTVGPKVAEEIMEDLQDAQKDGGRNRATELGQAMTKVAKLVPMTHAATDAMRVRMLQQTIAALLK